MHRLGVAFSVDTRYFQWLPLLQLVPHLDWVSSKTIEDVTRKTDSHTCS